MHAAAQFFVTFGARLVENLQDGFCQREATRCELQAVQDGEVALMPASRVTRCAPWLSAEAACQYCHPVSAPNVDSPRPVSPEPRPQAPLRYRSPDEDSARWLGFPFRPGDIVISTRSKSGTTWMQMICALLIFQAPELPAPLADLSPWLDWLIHPRAEVYDRLNAQEHRRFIKTHTPLDGLPLDPKATYVVVARHPLDMAVSLYHQAANIDRAKMRRLTGQPEPDRRWSDRPPVHDWLLSWIDGDDSRQDELDSLPGVLWHLSDAWARRAQPNVVLVHYDDLAADLEGQMRRLAGLLALSVPEQAWPRLVDAATFASMRSGAERLAPDPSGIFRDKSAFFRTGRSGSGEALLTAAELDRYRSRTAEQAPADLLEWLHDQRQPPR